MATTVFPQTDDTAARTAWQSLNVTINRGNDNGVSDKDTNLLKYEQDTTGSGSIDTDARYVSALSLDAGHTYYVRGCLVMEKYTVAATDDTILCGISLGTGMSAWAVGYKGNQVISGASAHIYIDALTGPSDNPMVQIKGTDNVTFANEPALWVDMLVVASEDADISWYYQKSSNANGTRYRADQLTWLAATPIKG